MINPELRRHLWLDFSPQKIILTPVIITAILCISYLSNHSVQGTAYLIFLFYLYIWGTKAASESIPDELTNRTWDYQRLSLMTPWNLSWGKLLGSTAYPWYGALIALIPYTFFSLQTESYFLFSSKLIILLVGALLAHAVALVSSMNVLQWEKSTKVNTFVYLLLGLWFSYSLSARALQFFEYQNYSAYSFYGLKFTNISFAFYSLCLFLGWALIGIYRRMRSALQYNSIPWVWFTFTLFCMGYFSEFFHSSTLTSVSARYPDSIGATFYQFKFHYYIALLTASLLTYIALFSDNIDLKLYKRLANKGLRKGNVPYWIASAIAAVGIALVIGFSSPLSFSLKDVAPSNPTVFIPSIFLLSFILFLTRDILLIHYFKFSENPKRSTLTALCYLTILYILIPSLLFALNVPSLLIAFFVPTSLKYGIISVLAPSLEVLFLASLIKKRRMAIS